MLQRGGLPSEVTLPGETSSPELCIEGRCGLRKTEKIFSANNEQGSLNREKKVVFRKTLKNFDLENFRSESSSCFRARVAEGRPAFRDRITVGNLESRIVYRGVGADLEKTGKYFRPPP